MKRIELARAAAMAFLAAGFLSSPLAATTSTSSIAFGGQSMGTTSPPAPVTVTNDAAGAITISSIVASGPFAQTNNCPPVLAPGANCLVNVTFTPPIAAGALNSTVPAAGNLVITSTAASSPNGVSLSGTGEKSLVSHFYRAILRRAPDAGGKSFWEGEGVRMQGLGANVNETWFAMAQFFYSSGEYQAFFRDNTGFVTDLYNTFFNRAPDAGGLAFWTGQLASGMPREIVLASFMFSSEFAVFAQGIFGNTAARAEVDVVGDFFRGLLARLPDSSGFNFWVGQFRTAQCQGASTVSAAAESISSTFVNSAEYAGRNRTNAQFVGDLYNSFLRRGGDLPGVNFWITQLNAGTQSRNQVRQAFLGSAEFQGRATAILNQGCLTPPADCSAAGTLCVGGPNSEYATIQAAVNAMSPGQTVLVFDGNYAGFRIPSSKSGTPSARTVVKASGANAVITSVNSANEGITVSNADYTTVEGFKVQNMPAFGVACHDASATNPMVGVILRNLTVTNSGSVNLYCSNAADSLIENNSTSGSQSSHGIYLSNGGADNTVIRGNVSFNNAKNGLHLNGDSSQGGDGLHTGITIEDNIFHDNTDNAMDLDGMHNSTVRNNLLYMNGHHGIRVFQLDASAGAGNLKIMNNTVVLPSPSNGGAAIKLTTDIGGHTIFNNILVNMGTSGTIVTGNTNFKSNNNIVVNSGFSVNEGSTMLNFTQWKALAGGYDSASIVSNVGALFVNPSTGDYRLKAGAPAINAGVATFNGVAAPTDDIAGVARPQGAAIDIGAYESF